MFIYVASPYTGAEQERYEAVMKFVAHHTKEGQILYSPIVHFHPMACQYDLPRDFPFWKKHIMVMLGEADNLWVLCLNGWQESKGVTYERDMAMELGLLTTYHMTV